MSSDIWIPAAGGREQIAAAIAVSLHSPIERALARATQLPLEDMRCAYNGDRVVATAGEYRFDQWFGGRSVPTSGIWGVSTLPEHRSAGLATACIRTLMDAARGRRRPHLAVSGGARTIQETRIRNRRDVRRSSPGA